MEVAEHLPHDHARGLQTAGRLAAWPPKKA